MSDPIRNRVIGYQEIAKSDLVLHPGHEWVHPDEQKKLLAEFVAEDGNISALAVRRHPSLEGKWEIIDGRLRFENLQLEKFSCVILDLNDEEAKRAVPRYNTLAHLSVTTNPTLLAMMKSVGGMVPDPESLLRKSPQIETSPTPDAGQTAGPTTGTPLRQEVKEKKVEQSGTHLYILLVIPLAKFADAQPHISELEKLSGITVQRTGEEPTPA